jgi:transcriptional regulator with XRE-family HTH domain
VVRAILLLFNERLKYLREQRNISQQDLADRLGVTRSTVSAWEAGINEPVLKTFVEIATFFNVSTDYLLSLEKSLNIDISELNEDDKATMLNLLNRLKQK